MKNIGILGGMSPESTIEYYNILIEESKKKLEDKKIPEIIIYNLNFQEFYNYMKNDEYEKASKLLSNKINKLEKAGADFSLIASNTPHLLLDQIKQKTSLPIIDIVETTALKAKKEDYNHLGLLGTRFTIKKDFYTKGLKQKNLEVTTPREEQIDYINKKIFNEFVQGKPPQKTLNRFQKIVKEMKKENQIDAIILGCTELPLYLNEKNLKTPTLDTTTLHAKRAIKKAIKT
ncbi:MAG: Aspartate racemase [Candidatus Methanohalarchaeum thermophilum]|uniref:Aspartate racemase n=1 Tax=Methanohalarchaeum thermophilum TaxID=1903181 RepID=A0A1Q6DSK2_METT1|nr:MAG: Aspartate racemase [Candidatus Methanohalarchaeum thermophilum]